MTTTEPAAGAWEVRHIDEDEVEAVRCSLLNREDAGQIADIFRVLSDPTRVLILHALSLAELCNGDLAAILGISESAVSHQMRDLRLMKLVTAEKRGRMVYYRLADSHIRHVFEDSLRHIKE
ncbi:MAG TPA: metalloregulator ArsR/SmtB family transcription factor [Dehalococcoidia bacterium]|nr:metalloregulator ArsR/SmtB family transcription factor [Dehalococcoidia bacterium]